MNENAGMLENDHENWIKIIKDMEKARTQISKIKQNSSWSITLCCCDLISTILNNTKEVKTVSVMIKDNFGIDKEVFLSLPCVLNSYGVGGFLNLKLNDEELKKLRNSAIVIDEIQKGINF